MRHPFKTAPVPNLISGNNFDGQNVTLTPREGRVISWLGIAMAAAGSLMLVSSRGGESRGRRMAMAGLLGLGLVLILFGLLSD
jgi:hypothetical protein